MSVSSLRRDAVGYFKASQPVGDARLGSYVDLSPDGYNFVTVAPGDYVIENGAEHDGVIYVFRRGSNGAWTERARLITPIPPYLDSHNTPLNMQVTMSGSGNTVAVGLPDYLHQASDANAGEVQVFQWSGASWKRTPVPRVSSSVFGRRVQLSASGLTLRAVSYPRPEIRPPGCHLQVGQWGLAKRTHHHRQDEHGILRLPRLQSRRLDAGPALHAPQRAAIRSSTFAPGPATTGQ